MLRGWYSYEGGIPEGVLNAFYDLCDSFYSGETTTDRFGPTKPLTEDSLLGQDDFLLALEDNTYAPAVAEHIPYEGSNAPSLIVRFKRVQVDPSAS